MSSALLKTLPAVLSFPVFHTVDVMGSHAVIPVVAQSSIARYSTVETAVSRDGHAGCTQCYCNSTALQ